MSLKEINHRNYKSNHRISWLSIYLMCNWGISGNFGIVVIIPSSNNWSAATVDLLLLFSVAFGVDDVCCNCLLSTLLFVEHNWFTPNVNGTLFVIVVVGNVVFNVIKLLGNNDCIWGNFGITLHPIFARLTLLIFVADINEGVDEFDNVLNKLSFELFNNNVEDGDVLFDDIDNVELCEGTDCDGFELIELNADRDGNEGNDASISCSISVISVLQI